MTNPQPIPYEQRDFTIQPGETLRWPGMALWVELLLTTADVLEISFYDGKAYSKLPQGILIPLAVQSAGYQLRNPSGSVITITIAKGYLPIQDNRVVFTAGALLNTNETPVAPGVFANSGAVAAGSTVLLAAGANLNGVRVNWAKVMVSDLPGAVLQMFITSGFQLAQARAGFLVGGAERFPLTLPAGQGITINLGGNIAAQGLYDLAYTIL